MSENSSVPWVSFALVVVGLAVLLFGAYVGDNRFVTGGGIVALAAVGLLTRFVARAEGPAHA